MSGDLYERSWNQELRTTYFVKFLKMLPPIIPVCEGPGQVFVKLVGGKSYCVSRYEGSLPYTLDGFCSNDSFLVIVIDHAFDCIVSRP